MKLSRFYSALALISAMAGGSALAASPAQSDGSGMSGRDCRKAFFAAKKDGTLNGMDYKAYKAEKCAMSGTAKTEETKAPGSEDTAKSSKAPAVAPVTSGNVVFPAKVDPQYASLTPGKARMKTCVAQYNANKENGGNGALKWIQKGGGYWPQCNEHLKGAQAQ